MQDRVRVIVVVAGVLAAATVVGPLTACGWRADRPSGADAVSVERATTTVPPGASSIRVDAPARLSPTPQAAHPAPEALIALATGDAAVRTGAVPSEVRIVQVAAREWPDRSLGCPRPGIGYAQAITPGYLIVVEADGRRLEYHTDHAQVVLCAS